MRKKEQVSEESLGSIIVLYIILLGALYYFKSPVFNTFLRYGEYGLLILLIVGLILIIVRIMRSVTKKRAARINLQKKEEGLQKKEAFENELITSVGQVGAENEVSNFINSFGYQKKKSYYWQHGDLTFTDKQLEVFAKTLREKGVKISDNNYISDVIAILNHYIDIMEERFIRESITSFSTHSFKELTGPQFENLLCRLYEKTGYSLKKTGKTGDQGCDLVVNMGSDRAIVQAKCYSGSVGNSAIQEALAAIKFYNCNKAIVVTNSVFTPEAIQLARVNNVELINGQQLRELITQHLKESWI